VIYRGIQDIILFSITTHLVMLLLNMDYFSHIYKLNVLEVLVTNLNYKITDLPVFVFHFVYAGT